MNKTQLVDKLAERFDGNRKQAQLALESVLDVIMREVARGEKVAITGFGSFEKRVRDARWVRNPATGERLKAKKKAVPKFNAGAELKAVVSGTKKLPKLPKPSDVARRATAPARQAADVAKKVAPRSSDSTSSNDGARPSTKATGARVGTTKAASTTTKKASSAGTSTTAKKATPRSTTKSSTTKSSTTKSSTTRSSATKKAAGATTKAASPAPSTARTTATKRTAKKAAASTDNGTAKTTTKRAAKKTSGDTAASSATTKRTAAKRVAGESGAAKTTAKRSTAKKAAKKS